jgi:hypothetical protein
MGYGLNGVVWVVIGEGEYLIEEVAMTDEFGN